MRRIKEFLKNRVEKAAQNQKGFSLVELIIVIAILGIIAAIALPNITGAIDNARKNTDVTNAKAIANAAVQAFAKDDELSSSLPAENKTSIVKLVETKDTTSITKDEKIANAILKELDNIPTPKYKGTAVDEDQFIISVDEHGQVTVYAADENVTGAAEATANTIVTEGNTPTAVQVYPALDGSNPYKTK